MEGVLCLSRGGPRTLRLRPAKKRQHFDLIEIVLMFTVSDHNCNSCLLVTTVLKPQYARANTSSLVQKYSMAVQWGNTAFFFSLLTREKLEVTLRI